MSNNPPPIPPSSSKTAHKPVQRAVFKESKTIRMGNVTFDYSLIEASHRKAEEWINKNPGIEIIQIQTFDSSCHGITVVWYR